MNREDLNPIAATRNDYNDFKDLSRPVQVWRFVKWGVIYISMIGVLARAATWMFLVPAWEREIQGTDRTLQGRLRILCFLRPPVTDCATSTAIVAQTGTAVMGYALLQTWGTVWVGTGSVPIWQVAGLLITAGYLMLDPVWGVIHRLRGKINVR